METTMAWGARVGSGSGCWASLLEAAARGRRAKEGGEAGRRRGPRGRTWWIKNDLLYRSAK